MNKYQQPLVSIVILDFERPTEATLLLDSIRKFVKFEHELVYVSNGGNQMHVKQFYDLGLIDILVLQKNNNGCGLGTKQGFKSATGKYVLYLQVDQWLRGTIDQNFIDQMVRYLENTPDCLYFDLAGDQGQGRFSERALFINREHYLAIPDLEEGVGGPGIFSNLLWSEEAVQNYMKRENLKIFHLGPIFGDNGKNSIRSYPCGGKILLTTDTKQLTILTPVTKRIDFPNLKLTDNEWGLILSNQWVNGTVPELHKPDSFVAWQKVVGVEDFKQ